MPPLIEERASRRDIYALYSRLLFTPYAKRVRTKRVLYAQGRMFNGQEALEKLQNDFAAEDEEV